MKLAARIWATSLLLEVIIISCGAALDWHNQAPWTRPILGVVIPLLLTQLAVIILGILLMLIWCDVGKKASDEP